MKIFQRISFERYWIIDIWPDFIPVFNIFRTIAIQSWGKTKIDHIEKAIFYANLRFNPVNNDELNKLHKQELTEDLERDIEAKENDMIL